MHEKHLALIDINDWTALAALSQGLVESPRLLPASGPSLPSVNFVWQI